MKTTILSITTALLVTACGTSIKQIGYLNQISTRNVSPKETYVNIKSYVGGDKKELKRNKAKTLDEAVTKLVKSVPGGEFMQNVKVYVLNSKYYSVEGDVWGTESRNYKGFKVGDKVVWQDGFVKYMGTIVDLKNDKEVTIKQDENGKIRAAKYEDLSKVD